MPGTSKILETQKDRIHTYTLTHPQLQEAHIIVGYLCHGNF